MAKWDPGDTCSWNYTTETIFRVLAGVKMAAFQIYFIPYFFFLILVRTAAGLKKYVLLYAVYIQLVRTNLS